MQKFNRYSRLLAVSTILYILIQLLYSWRMPAGAQSTLYGLFSSLIIAGNVFFIFYLSSRFSDRVLRIYNSYLLFSTFLFYMTYCMKIALIADDPEVLGGPLLLELLLLIALLYNGVLIFHYSRILKKKEKETKKKRRRLFLELFSWIDALLSAVIFVLLINIFLFQIYSIPSESMFPVFLVKDRPVVDKITRGPGLPFTRFRVPPLRGIDRGDIVTFRNPKYEKTVESELKHFFSQFLYMVTFTGVNLDRYDEYGNEKADPLVKRVVAVPGEQIQIVNDKVYLRRDLQSDFAVQEEDIHSQTDLYNLPDRVLRRLRSLPINKVARENLSKWDAAVESLDPESTASLIKASRAKADQIRSVLTAQHNQAVKNGVRVQYDQLNSSRLSVNNRYLPFQKIDYLLDDQVHFIYNLDDDTLWENAWSFISSYLAPEEDNLYARIASRTDLMYKFLLSNWIVVNLEYLEYHIVGSDQMLQGIQAASDLQERRMTQFKEYITRYYDFRNLPPFPENGLIPEDHYFLMGDNRYNSLDLRHGLHPKNRYFIEGEESSFVYRSLLSPMLIQESGIEGFVVFRLFPMGRIGRP